MILQIQSCTHVTKSYGHNEYNNLSSTAIIFILRFNLREQRRVWQVTIFWLYFMTVDCQNRADLLCNQN